jgi:hypothetical protein
MGLWAFISKVASLRTSAKSANSRPVFPKQILIICLITLISSVFSAMCFAQTNSKAKTVIPKLIQYRAVYSLSWRSFKVGTSFHTVKKIDRNRYMAEASSAPNASILPFKSFEKSYFMLKNNLIYPLDYEYANQENTRIKEGRIRFDWKNKKIKVLQGESPPTLVLPEKAQDKITENLQFRLQLQEEFHKGLRSYSYTVVERNKIRVYTFNVLSEEKIGTPIGVLESVLVEHISENKKRRTLLWLAKDYHYLIVKLQQFREGSLSGESEILSYEPL